VGDSVDNIPGVPGVGPKTATDLLGRFGSVDGIYHALEEVGSVRIREALRGAEAAVRRNVELIRLRTDLPVCFDDDHLRPKPAQGDRLRELYQRWGFRSLAAQLDPAGPRQGELL
jgi:DNA polymerase I